MESITKKFYELLDREANGEVIDWRNVSGLLLELMLEYENINNL